MANVTPFDLIKLIKSKGPQGAAETIAQENFPNNPMINDLLELGRQGNRQGLEQVAQQMFRQNGRDYATEMNSFLDMMRSLR